MTSIPRAGRVSEVPPVGRQVVPDAVRLAVGTLTVVRVPAPRRVDAKVTRTAMLLAPLVGLVLGTVASGVLFLVRWVGTHPNALSAGSHYADAAWVRNLVVEALAAALALTLLAWMTRALHLDGLADTADALGVKQSDDPVATRKRRLSVMREPSTGAFGVVTVALGLLVQVTALLVCVVAGHGTVALIAAVVTGRLAATWACTTGVPAARTDGLAATVARAVPVPAAALLTLVVMGGAYGIGTLDSETSVRVCVVLTLSVLVGLAATAMMLRRCVRAFGGITGDVLGACVELATTAVLLTVALFS